LLPEELTRLGKNIASAATFTLNFVLKQNTGYFDASGEQNAVLHLWSLCIEEQFYFIFPTIFLLAYKLKLNRFLIIGIVIVASFYLNVSIVAESATAAFYLPTTRFWEMAIGSLLAAVATKEFFTKIESFSPLISASGLLLILSSILLIDKSMEFPGWVALAPTVGAVLILSIHQQNNFNRFLSHPVMVWVGQISYPLYLWHYPIFAYLRVYEGGAPELEMKLVAMALSVLLAWLTYVLIEFPIRFGAARRLPNKVVIGCLVGLLLVIAVIGKKTQGARGFPSRVSQQQTETPIHSEGKVESFPCNNIRFKADELNCLIMDPEREPTHALIGDSHAAHFYTGVAEYVKQRGGNLILLSGPGCVPFVGIRTRNAKGDPQTCGPIVSEIHEFLDSRSEIKTVVMATRGPITLTGKPFGEEEVIGRYIDSDDYPNANNFNELFSQSLDATLLRLKSHGKKVVIVLDNPELGFNPILCNDLPLVRKTRQSCTIDRVEVDIRNNEYRTLINQAAENHPGIAVVDTFKTFCDSSFCHAKKDGQWLYRDNNHLTEFGSSQLKSIYEFE
jgi:peptidoglycan/LPS O-acetylase OafA/YrhL